MLDLIAYRDPTLHAGEPGPLGLESLAPALGPSERPGRAGPRASLARRSGTLGVTGERSTIPRLRAKASGPPTSSAPMTGFSTDRQRKVKPLFHWPVRILKRDLAPGSYSRSC